jgi:hypothetical protein
VPYEGSRSCWPVGERYSYIFLIKWFAALELVAGEAALRPAFNWTRQGRRECRADRDECQPAAMVQHSVVAIAHTEQYNPLGLACRLQPQRSGRG